MNSENPLQTQFNFVLPKGLVDDRGKVHRLGVMRLATALDEICVQKDRGAMENPAYGVLAILARSLVRLGDLEEITPDLLEGLFIVDLAYLREFYNRINQQGNAYILVQCPKCCSDFRVEIELAGE